MDDTAVLLWVMFLGIVATALFGIWNTLVFLGVGLLVLIFLTVISE